jgi:transposase
MGHRGTSRGKPHRVDRVVVHELEACQDCRGKVVPLDYHRERYVEDIVPVRLFVTKHVIRHSYCPTCDKVVYPEVPEVLGSHRFGIQFLLYITYLRYVLNLPYNKIAGLLNDTYGAGVSDGALVEYVRLAARLFGHEYERIKREMREAATCHYDDTGQRVEGGEPLALGLHKQESRVLPHLGEQE